MTMTACFEAQVFIRHRCQLRALQLDHQAWFCLQDTARLMGRTLDERATYKLDPDQRCTAWLKSDGKWSKQLLISESGLFAMLVHHYVPENRALRHWLTHEVLPTLRDKAEPHAPSISSLRWGGSSVGLLEWQSDHWIRVRDMPQVWSKHIETSTFKGFWYKLSAFWRPRRVTDFAQWRSNRF
jgi:prophage antirepressor-like protein